MTMAQAPTSRRVVLICTGRRKDGTRCEHKLGVLNALVFEGIIEIKCPKCGKVTTFS